MDCRACFKVYIDTLEQDDVFDLIDMIGIEPGITEHCLYFNLKEESTESDDWQLSTFLDVLLEPLMNKKEVLKELSERYFLNYIIDVKFNDIEQEIRNKRSFDISDTLKEFIEYTDSYFNLNDGYFEQ